jgi:hypothetical protein
MDVLSVGFFWGIITSNKLPVLAQAGVMMVGR